MILKDKSNNVLSGSGRRTSIKGGSSKQGARGTAGVGRRHSTTTSNVSSRRRSMMLPPPPPASSSSSTRKEVGQPSFSRVGTKLPPKTSSKKEPVTAKSREEYYTSIHESMTSDVDRFKENVEARMSSQDLIIAEYETDKIQQLELEELNQQSFDHLRAEIKTMWERNTGDVGVLKSYTTRSIDVLNDAFAVLQRKVESNCLTSAKKSQLHSQIESNVMKTVVSTLEAQMNREFQTLKLDVRHSLTEAERNGVLQKSAMQGLEQRMYEHQQQMFEIEKSQAKMSLLYPGDKELGEAVGGGVPGHRLSVLDFGVKGLTDRLNNLEAEFRKRDEKFESMVQAGMRKMEERAEEIVGELRGELEEGRKESEKIVVESKQSIGRMIFDFESTSRANAATQNREALEVASKSSRRVEEGCTYMRKSLDLLETKIGRVRIDFDRMVGDTTSACEALADGLSSVRGDVRGVNQKQIDFEKSLVERGGMGNGGVGGLGGYGWRNT